MIKIYDTMTRSLREFVPIEEGKVRMYVCGLTVYNYIHVGNARSTVAFGGAHQPALPPRRADLLARVRLLRAVRPAAEPRRGRARQGLPAVQDAGRPLAGAGRAARPVRLPVVPPGQAAAVHGQ